MALKPRYKRRILWSLITALGVLIMAIVVIPPMINLNYLKPKIEQTIVDQTGVKAQINGDVNFSLIGKATLVAHDVSVTQGTIGAVMFSVPFSDIFDLENATLTGKITIYNAKASLSTLIPQSFNTPIEIYNSDITFKNRSFEIISATLNYGHLVGVIRTKNHKYDVDFENDEFYVRNRNDKLKISGRLFADGGARGNITMETANINNWFGFAEPRIDKTIKLTMDFDWDGGLGWDFKNIDMGNIKGNISILPDGEKIIQLRGNNVNFDFSFLTEQSKIFYQTKFDLDFTGNLQFGEYVFKHLKINATGTKDALNVNNIIADDIAITGGKIDANGAQAVLITMPYEGVPATCMFYGTPENWRCTRFSYDDYVGAISITPEKFDLLIYSQKPMPERTKVIKQLLELAPRGYIDFEFADIAGTYTIDKDNIIPTYKYAYGKSLNWLDPNLTQMPKFMYNDIGDFSWDGDLMHFAPYSGTWDLYLTKTYFSLSGTNIKDWLPNLDLIAFKDMPYKISGNYNADKASNLEIQIGNQTFTGSLSGNNITLYTDIFNIDSFINQYYLDNYEELGYLTASPITIPFLLPINISISANELIYNGTAFKNFVYSLKPNIQTFSITDNDRGNLLATFKRNGNKYDIFAQLNRFVIDGYLLSSTMPLNVKDAMITAEIRMNTSGNIAHDLEYNLEGDMDLTFDGGYLIGLGIDEFFASAETITTFNAEYVLSYALEKGESAIKNMRVIGKYKNGDFRTTKPIALQLRHTDATGELSISDGLMSGSFNLILRGTSPIPAPINLTINPDGTRKYSLSEIMINFDPTFMRDFIRTHNKF